MLRGCLLMNVDPHQPKPVSSQQTTETSTVWTHHAKKVWRFLVSIYDWAQNKWTKALPPPMEPTDSPAIVKKIQSLGNAVTGDVYKVEAYDSSGAKRTDIYKLERNKYGNTLEKETRILHKLSHPNIVKVDDNSDQKKVVIINERQLDLNLKETDSSYEAEYVDIDVDYAGKAALQMRAAPDNLDVVESDLTPEQKHEATLNLLSAVDYLHENQVCHMDIKPFNMFWTGDKLLLTNFDGAIAGAAPGGVFINSNNYTSVSLTPFYASPESINFLAVFQTQKPYSAQAHDVWCSACSIAEILTGEDLFPSAYDGVHHTTFAAINSYPLQKRLDEYFEKHHEIIGPERTAILKAMLQTDPDKRITASEALQRFSAVGLKADSASQRL